MLLMEHCDDAVTGLEPGHMFADSENSSGSIGARDYVRFYVPWIPTPCHDEVTILSHSEQIDRIIRINKDPYVDGSSFNYIILILITATWTSLRYKLTFD